MGGRGQEAEQHEQREGKDDVWDCRADFESVWEGGGWRASKSSRARPSGRVGGTSRLRFGVEGGRFSRGGGVDVPPL